MIQIIDSRANNNQEIIQNILNRSQLELIDQQNVVNEIVTNVQCNKDQALFEYTNKFDHIQLDKDTIKVTEHEINEAYNKIDSQLISIIRKAKKRIIDFHDKQKRNTWIDMKDNGEILGQKITPIDKVGVYVPGGKAVYPSSVLMNVLPAQVAGVRKIIMVTPPQKDGSIHPGILVAAKEAGVTEIYKVGGAQAIAALAYGTESVPKVDKIVGPGNIYVTLAKRAVFGYVNIDSIAGPSEILVIADKTAQPAYVAADLLSQAEHDELASSILITDSEELAQQVKEELALQTQKLSRKSIIEKSLVNYGAIVIVDQLKQAVDLSNNIAPEHLEICTAEPFALLPQIKNAGAIFLGNYSPEPLGDYMAGPNHVLPTSGTAKFFSPLGVDDFIKKSSIISFSEEALKDLHQDIISFAQSEELTAHANAIKIRFVDKL